MTDLQGWLNSESPESRLQARVAGIYHGWQEFKTNRLALLGLFILILLVLMAVFAPWISPHDPFEQNLAGRLQPLGAEGHVLGTDSLGRDILSRLIHGSRITLYIVGLVALIAPVFGLLIGTVAGYLGGWADVVLMRFTDIFLAFPRLVLALAFVAALGAGIENAVLAIALTAWPPYARIARAETLSIRRSDYISAVKLQGAGAMRIITRHIWPLCIASLVVRITLDMAGIILAAAGLGFLGLGARPPSPEWGAMIAEGRRFILDYWWVATIPGIAIFVVSLAFNLLGDGLRDLLDPKEWWLMNLLEVADLKVSFPTRNGVFDAVRGVSFSLGHERLGIVGESGSGKSLTGRAILRLIRPPGKVSATRMLLEGDDLLSMSDKAMRGVRGQRISMVMQDPKFSLNPVMSVGAQIVEAYRQSDRVSRQERRQKALEMLDAVAIRDPERVFNAYPHELSGGMGQRVMIAMMLIPNPRILIADEPTSALDVTVQMQVLNIMDKLVSQRGMGLIFISHDLNLVSSFCDRVLIMYAGRIVETCRADELYQAKHPYTQGLLNSLPRLDAPSKRLSVLQRDPAWRDSE